MITGDVRVRFPQPQTAHEIFEQQLNSCKTNNKGIGYLRTFDGQRCPVLNPTGVNTATAEDKSLYKAFASSDHFRGKDDLHLRVLLQQTLQYLYEDANTDAEGDLIPPDDIINSLSEALDAAKRKNSQAIQLDNKDLLYLLEYNKVYKIGG